MNRNPSLPLIKKHRRHVIQVRHSQFPSLLYESQSTRHFSSNLPPTGQSIRQVFLKTREKNRGEKDLKPIGEGARLKFYKSNRKLKKIQQSLKLNQELEAPDIAYLSQCSTTRIIPQALGLVRRKGDPAIFDLKGLSMGNFYADAFSSSLKTYGSVEKMILASNRLTEIGSSKILTSIAKDNLTCIDLSHNIIGANSVKIIISILSNNRMPLRRLILENVNLMEQDAIDIMGAIEDNSNLVRLNLARNNLQSNACKAVASLLFYNSTVKYLDLHWNKLRGDYSVNLFNSLAQNTTLIFLDLSWNSLGRLNNPEVAEAISNSFQQNSKLSHIDLSYNYFSKQECEVMAKGIVNNHTIYGIHLQGNDCIVDSRGFIIPQETTMNMNQGHLFRRISETPRDHCYKEQMVNCWICEKWVEINLQWVPGVSGKEDHDPIFLHLECDDYQPEVLIRNQHSGAYDITRVVPNNPCNLFFSYMTRPIYSKDYPFEKQKIKIKKLMHYWQGCDLEVEIPCINIVKPKGRVCEFRDLFNTTPRIAPNVYVPPEAALERIDWSIPISLFKDYKFDSPKLLMECFEFDWTHCKIPNMIKNEDDLNSVKEILRSVYSPIRETYKYISSICGGEVPSITSNFVLDFLNQCNVNDNLYSSSDVGVNWNATVLQKIRGMICNPGNALVRYEFMEFITRVAHDRYLRNKIVETDTQALQKILDEHMMKILIKQDSNRWRWDSYICEDIDLTLKAHKPILDALYKKFSGKKTLPGYKPFMSLEEFQMLCQILTNDWFASRDIDMVYYLSMMTQVDELFKKRHIEMTFVEFLEALCRAIDMSSPAMPKEEGDEGQGIQVDPRKLPLQHKIMNAFKILIKLCPPGVQQSFEFPTFDSIEMMKYRKPNS